MAVENVVESTEKVSELNGQEKKIYDGLMKELTSLTDQDKDTDVDNTDIVQRKDALDTKIQQAIGAKTFDNSNEGKIKAAIHEATVDGTKIADIISVEDQQKIEADKIAKAKAEAEELAKKEEQKKFDAEVVSAKEKMKQENEQKLQRIKEIDRKLGAENNSIAEKIYNKQESNGFTDNTIIENSVKGNLLTGVDLYGDGTNGNNIAYLQPARVAEQLGMTWAEVKQNWNNVNILDESGNKILYNPKDTTGKSNMRIVEKLLAMNELINEKRLLEEETKQYAADYETAT